MAAFVSLDELEHGQALTADLAIVGAGAAGITIARALAGAPIDVLLIESGGLDLEGPTQELMEGTSVGLPYEPLVTARQRFFGGTTNHWTGWCRPLDPIDLAPRPWLAGGIEGWPLTYAELEPYYRRAQPVCELGAYRYEGEEISRELGEELDAFDPALLELKSYTRSPPTRFGQRYRQDLLDAPNVRVLLQANLERIALDPVAGGRRVDRIDLVSLAGKRVAVRARRHVLACGGIENPRLLLASNDVRPEGVGNASDWVGRCFMEHPHWTVGEIAPADPTDFVDRYYRHYLEGLLRRMAWRLTERAQAETGSSNCYALLNLELDREGPASAARRLWRDLRAGEVPEDAGARALEVLGGLGTLARAAWRKHVQNAYVNKPIKAIQLDLALDPLPERESRVTLDPVERDALGMPKPRLDWRLHPDDERHMTTLAVTVAAEITRLGLGRVRLNPALADPAGGWAQAGNLVGYDLAPGMPTMYISWHHMGTTRMAADPAEGVVDAACRVHGVDDLYVAGSSVMPTTGAANPTLTIVALALRLADHLRGELAGGGRPGAAADPSRGPA